MMTRSRKEGSARSTTEEETATETTGTSAATSETLTDSSARTEDTTVVEDADATLIQKHKKTAKSKSDKANQKKKELEARLELEKLKLEEMKIKTQLASTKLELARLHEDDTDLSDDEKDAEAEAAAAKATEAWVSKSKDGERSVAATNAEASRPTETVSSTTTHTNRLAEAIIEAVKSAADGKATSMMQRAPKYVSELHQFDGDARDWMAFKATYKDTHTLFSAIENMGRLRRAIKGKAKEAVKSLLYTQVDPEEVMSALERRFGRPTYLIRSEIENIEKLPPMSEDARELVRYAGAIANTVSVVKQMKKQSYLHSSDISNRIIEKMCTLVRFKWYEYRASKEEEDEPILISLMNFFNCMVDQFEMHEFTGTKVKREAGKGRMRSSGLRSVHATRAAQNSEEEYSSNEEESDEESEPYTAAVCSCKDNTKKPERIVCPECAGEHTLTKCKKFIEASTDERWNQARRNSMCFRCLQGRHRGYTCKAKPCAKCKRNHHVTLHPDETTRTKALETQAVASAVNATRSIAKAYLKIVPVELWGPEAKAHVYALMDEGSTVTLIEDDIVNMIGAQGPEEELRIEGVGGHRMNQKSKKIDIKVKGKFERNLEKMSGYTVKALNLTPQEVSDEDLEGCHHLEEITEQLKYPNVRPTVLIGQDNWHLIVSQEVKTGNRSKPVASRTQLGWVLHGTRTSNTLIRTVNHLATTPRGKDDHLEKMIRDHFDIEALGIAAKRPSNDIDQRALDVLDSTTRRLPTGGFSTGLIWKTDDERLPESKTAAMRRLKGMEKKFLKDKEFERKYEEQVENLINSEYAEEVTEEPTSTRTWYLPHFAVVHPQKGKMRLVFDAAAKSNGRSLNDALLAGPDLLQSLFGVLLRFRQEAVAVVADIKEMFLRIKINEEDRDSLRFLWKNKEYRMTSLIFGAACSPCTAIYVKNRNAEDSNKDYPEAVRAIKREHYMDDFIASFSDASTAARVSMEVDAIHKKGGFFLRGWASNVPAAIEELTDTENKSNSIRLGEQKNQVEKTLGLNWNVHEDSLHFTLNLRNTPNEVKEGRRAPTKREATSAVMSVFDPLGLASPITVQGKAMLQNLWRVGLEWDEELPSCREEEWRKWLEDLRKLEDLRIPRCLTYDVTEGELHTFCDASEKAYACAVYWRSQHPDNRVEVKLLTAKARVSPLKQTSIPRLELQACLLGSRLANTVSQELDLTITRKYFWTDSRTALTWIKSDPRRFKPFVAHRLAEIEELTKHKEWHWVPTKHNVADDATRNTPSNFDVTHRWFTGPAFLYEDPRNWPADAKEINVTDTGEERPNATTLSVRRFIPVIVPDPARFSSWTRLLHATARFLQAVDVFRRKVKEKVNITKHIIRKHRDPAWKRTPERKIPSLKKIQRREEDIFLPKSALYVEKAEQLLIRKVQEDSFSEELVALSKKAEFKSTSKLKNLTLKIEDGIIRISTRIGAAKYLIASYKNPILLDKQHRITQLLVKYIHEAFNHGNHNTIMNEIRQKYWIPSLRNMVKTTARNCGWCKLRKRTPQITPQGDLPPERLTKTSPPFTCTGVDYFGPMFVTIGRRIEKRWGALFTCLTTRAIHLELAASLSTDSMVLALRRMIARRGTPKIILSDNGTNFTGASREIAEAIAHLGKETNKMGIVWKFIPPGAPHMGGAWERMVRSVKVALAATLHERQPREEILHTLLLEAEHIVNSRPLFAASTDPEEEEALTPNHFLIGRSCGATLFGSFDDTELIGSPSWRTSQRLADHFWSRWVREYLPTLSPRYNQGPHYRDPVVGDIVLIVDHTLPRYSWPRGEITATHPGPDGRTRIVDVRCAAGILRRPASRLVLIVPATSPQRHGVQRTEGETVGDEHQ